MVCNLTHKLGGKVVPADAGNREYGQSKLIRIVFSLFFDSTIEEQLVLASHGDVVIEIPADFVRTGTCWLSFAAIEHPAKKIYGI